MRNPITVDTPTADELSILKDRERATSLVYEHLVTKFGLGVAERWLEALDVSRGTDPLSLVARETSLTHGWVMSANAASERIAQKIHVVPAQHILEMSLRSWNDAKKRDQQQRRG